MIGVLPSAEYKAHWNDPDAWFDWQIRLYDDQDQIIMTAGLDALKDLKYDCMLSDEDGIPIGGVCAERWTAMVELARCTSGSGSAGARDWPKNARAQVCGRLFYGDGIPCLDFCRGVFKAASRPKTHDGILTVSGYNAAMDLDQPWMDKIQDPPASWPITSYQAADLLRTALGIRGFNNLSLLDDSVPLIPFNTEQTARETLRAIAAANGGNIQVQQRDRPTVGTLRVNSTRLIFIPLRSVEAGTSAVAGIAVAGRAIVGTASPASASGVGTTYVGRDLMKLEIGDPYPAVTGVVLTADDGRVGAAGTEDGTVLRAACNAYDMDAAAALCLNKTRGFVYRPFTGETVWLDPAADVGDLAIIDGTAYQLCNLSWTLGAHPCCDAEAPFPDDAEEENPHQSEAKKALQLALNAAKQSDVSEMYSYIRQALAEIELAVGSKVGEDEIISKINLSQEGATISGDKIDLEGKEIHFKVGDDGKISFIVNGATLASFHLAQIEGLGQSAALDGTLPIYIASNGNDIELVAYSAPSSTLKKYASLYIDNDGAMTFKTYTATYYPESGLWIEGNITEMSFSDSSGMHLRLADGTSGTVSSAVINGHVVLVLT